MTSILYLCDGERPDCKKPHCYKTGGNCRHTFDVEHARNFAKETFFSENKMIEAVYTEEERIIYVENTDLHTDV